MTTDPCGDRILRVEALEKQLDERMAGRWKLDDERWTAHREQHAVIASELVRSQAAANEWRGSLSDLRSTFLPSAVWDSEHRALVVRVIALERLEAEHRAAMVATRSVFSDSRAVILFGIALVAIAIAVWGAIK